MFEWLPFEKQEGSWREKNVLVLALTTCAFCTRGMEYLRNKDIEFRYVYIDKLSPQEKKKLSEEFKDKFGQRVLYPTIIIDESDFQLGFIEKAWSKSLGLKD